MASDKNKTKAQLIDELKALRERVERVEDRAAVGRTIFDGAGDAVFIHRGRGPFLNVNAAACELLGHDRETLLTLSRFPSGRRS